MNGFTGVATSDYCSSKVFLGITGTATCVSGTANATDVDVANGKTYWNAAGAVRTGSATLAQPVATLSTGAITLGTGSFASVISITYAGTGVSAGTLTLAGTDATSFKIYGGEFTSRPNSTGVVRYAITSADTAKVVVVWTADHGSALSASLTHQPSVGSTSAVTISTTASSSVLRNWYRADAIIGVADNAVLSTWTDQVGSYNLSAAPGPNYVASYNREPPALRFTPGQELRNTSVVAPTLPYSAAVVYSTQAGYGNLLVFTSGGGIFENLHTYGGSGTVNMYNEYSGVASGVARSIRVSGLNVVYLEMGGISAAATAKLYANGAASATGAVTGTRATPATMTTMEVGMLNGNWGQFNGYIAEVMIFNNALSADQRAEMHCYLANKYGLENLYSACP